MPQLLNRRGIACIVALAGLIAWPGLAAGAAQDVGTNGPIDPGDPVLTDLIPPAAITDLAAVPIDSVTVLLTWTSTGDNGMNGTADHYNIRYSTSGPITVWSAATPVGPTQATVTPPKAPGSPESLIVTGLNPTNQDLTVWLALRIHDDAGNYSTSNSASADLPADLVAPAAVANLEVAVLDAVTFSLSWLPPGDNGQTGTATSYQVRYSTEAILDADAFDAAVAVTDNVPTPLPASSTTVQSVNVVVPVPGTYFIALRALDEVGNAGDPASVEISTAPPSVGASEEGGSGGMGGGCGGRSAGGSAFLIWTALLLLPAVGFASRR